MKYPVISVLYILSLLIISYDAVPLSQKDHAKIFTLPLIRRESNKLDRRAPGQFTAPLLSQQYVVSVGIGTPVQKLNLVVDTTQADFWVASASCLQCTSKSTYNYTSSSTANQTDPQRYEIFMNTFGYYATDTVAINGLSVQNQEIFTITDTISSVDIDGNLGIAYSNLSIGGHNSFLFTAAQNGLIPSATVGMYLSRELGNDTVGELSFGGPNNAHIQGNLSTVPAVQDPNGNYTLWVAHLNSLSINGNEVANSSAGTTKVIFDTTQFNTYLYDEIVQGFYKNIPGIVNDTAGNYYFNCSAFSLNNTIAFGFDNNVKITINPKDIMNNIGGEDDCMGTIVSTLANNGTQSVGLAILRSVYVLYDGTKNMLGLGQSI